MGKRKHSSGRGISKDNNNNNNNNNKGGKGNKKQKKTIDKFWIESCVEKKPNNPKVLKHAIHLWITRVELFDDHPSAVISTMVAPISTTTEAAEAGVEDKSLLPAIAAPNVSSGSPIATLETASIASDDDDDLHSSSTTTASFQGKEDGEDGAVMKRPEPFICVHIHPSAKKKIKVSKICVCKNMETLS
jgi:hypothetical protein